MIDSVVGSQKLTRKVLNYIQDHEPRIDQRFSKVQATETGVGKLCF